jgi:hypothetical protein
LENNIKKEVVMFSDLIQELSSFPGEERVSRVCWPRNENPCPFLKKINGVYRCLGNSQARTKIEKEHRGITLIPRCRGMLDILLSKKNLLCQAGLIYKIAYPDYRKEGIIEKVKIKEIRGVEKLFIILKIFPDFEKEVISFELNTLAIDILTDTLILGPLGFGVCLGQAEISENRGVFLKNSIYNTKEGRW